jgi:carboxyl-terminal processing protease
MMIKPVVKGILAVLVLVLILPVSRVAQSSGQPEPETTIPATPGLPQLTLDDLRTFTDVFAQIRQNYVEEIDDRTLLEAGINGMLLALDPHSSFLSASDYDDLEEYSSGQFTGIGVDLMIRNDRIVVRSVVSPSPADRSGMEPGDVITAINDRPVKNRPLQQAIDELHGEPGSTVNITVFRKGKKFADLSLEREVIVAPSIDFRLLEGKYGYFDISYFNRETAVTVSDALDSIEQDGTMLEGLILDLRDNTGGVLQSAVALADGFLEKGLIVTTQGRNQAMQLEFEASPGQWTENIPLVILVDQGSASSSEVLAGALQDHGRALIVGERTFGKGSIQSVLPLRNGSGLKLTTARYFTPSGRSIQAEGIQPDVIVESTRIMDGKDQRLRESDLDGHLSKKSAVSDKDRKNSFEGDSVSPEEDYALHQALNLLKGTAILFQEPARENILNAELERKHE